MKNGKIKLPRLNAYSMAALTCGVAALLFWAGILLFRPASSLSKINAGLKPASVWTLRRNGEFGGLGAAFFRDGRRMHVYTEFSQVLNDKTGRKEPSPDWDELRDRWRGEPYYHEVYDLSDGEWVKRTREFARASDSNLGFEACDYGENLELPIEKKIKDELPSSIKIKAVLRFQEYVAVLYGDPNEQRPYPYNDHPPLEMDLLVPDKVGWRVADSQEVDEYGYLCTVTTFSTQLPGGENARVFLVITADPSATSEFFTANSFLLRKYQR